MDFNARHTKDSTEKPLSINFTVYLTPQLNASFNDSDMLGI